METKKSLEKRIHDKLLAVRRGTVGKSPLLQGYSAPQLANDVAFNLALAAEKGHLTLEQYAHFDTATRAELVCEFLTEARDLLDRNRANYGVDTSKGWGRTDAEMNKEKNVYRLTRAELSNKRGVDDWHSSYKPYGVNVDDVLYGRFLREHGLTDQKGVEITEADLPSLESIGKSHQPDVLKKYLFLQRAQL